MKTLVSKLYSIPARLKQRGSISIFGILAMISSVSGVGIMVSLSDASVDRANFSSYAESVAPAALYAKLSLTAEDAGNTDPEAVVRTMLNSANVDPKIELWYGKIDGNNFVEVQNENEITAVAVKISRDYKIFNTGGSVVGTAIYGLGTDVADDDGVISTCYCQDRFSACINADNMAEGIPSDAAGQRVKAAMGEPGSDKRINYCMFGYTEPHPTEAGYSKYPNFTVFIESLGRGIGDLKAIAPGSNYAAALSQKPLLNVAKQNQFAIKGGTDVRMTASSYRFQGYTPTENMGTLFGAEKPYVEGFLHTKNGITYDKKMRSGLFSSPSDHEIEDPVYRNIANVSGYDIQSHTQKGKTIIIPRDVNADWVWPTGYYYVGYVGTCIPDTNMVNASEASGLHVDMFDSTTVTSTGWMGIVKKEKKEYHDIKVAQSTDNSTVKRCLSYHEVIDRNRDWATVFGIFKVPALTSSSLKGYLQTSCVDFNRDAATRITWRDWIKNNLSFKEQHRSFESFGCVKKQMTWHRSIFFAGFY